MNISDLKHHVEKQLRNIMCWNIDITSYIEEAVSRSHKAFISSANKYYYSNAGGGGG